ncbi:MAG: sensor histidine kinase [Jatrophihabitans sp.]|uniref:sensor histidine kinase n=1 Tax=Jatrophihabitans sp. TaxID=1932789 RepID=UPI003F811E69
MSTDAPEPAADGPSARPVWTLRRRLRRTFLVSGTAIAVVTVLAVLSLARLSAAGDDVISRRQPAALAAQRVLSAVRAEATTLRDYASSGVHAYLEAYDTLVAERAKEIGTVARLSSGDPAALGAVRRLQDALTAWNADVVRPVVSAREGAATDQSARLDEPAARVAFARARGAAEQLLSTLEQRVTAGRAARVVDRRLLWAVLGTGLAIVVASGIVLWRGFQRWVIGPVERLGAQTRIVAAGATRRVITPDGPQELAMLGADVEAVRRQIAEQLGHAERIQDELTRRGSELARSNADLQQFAYVASHDLSEPLRKVANFCQLLERQYGPQLDDRARQYIDFAVDGARRMQTLIADLLALSRVGRTTEAFVPVDLHEVLGRAVATLSLRIGEARASVEYGRLPIVPGDPTLLQSLFENLVGNAIKYRRPDVAPRVVIGAEHDSSEAVWQCSVTDNGIGIEPQYGDRIFQVFQRLHLRDEYAGTGIGLALCRRIVEFHGGRIWLDTEPTHDGATFRFTLPEGHSA